MLRAMVADMVIPPVKLLRSLKAYTVSPPSLQVSFLSCSMHVVRPNCWHSVWTVAMSFRSDEHYCLIRHKMIFEGGVVRRGEVNICTATKLVVGDNGRVTFYTD